MFGNEPVRIDPRWTPRALGLLRIITSLLFIQHGTSKHFGFPPSPMPAPDVWSLPWVAGWMEVVFGFMLLIGLLTRPVAFLLAGEMAVAYWYVHAPQNFFPLANMGEPAILYSFIFILFVAAGPGAWSLDRMIPKNTSGIEGYAAPGGERS